MKRIISTLLSLVIMFGVVSIAPVKTEAVEETVENNSNQSFDFSEYFKDKVNQADYFNEKIYTADSLVSDSKMDEINHYINSDRSSKYMVNYLKSRPLFTAAYATWEAGNFIAGPVETTIKLTNKTPYYENLLIKLIDATFEEKSFADIFKRESIQKALKFRKKFVNAADTFLSTNYLLDRKEFVDLGIEDKEKVQEFAKSFVKDEPYHIGEDTVNQLDEILSGLDSFEKLYKTVGTYATICEVEQSTIDFLKRMKEQTDNLYLKDAIDDVTVMHDNSFFGLIRNTSYSLLQALLKQELSYLVKEWKKMRLTYLQDGSLTAFLKIDPVLIATQLTLSLGNAAFSIDKKLDKYETMKAICDIEDTAEKAFNAQVSSYKQIRQSAVNYDNTEAIEESGEIIVSGVKFLFNSYINDSDLYKDMLEICRKDWISTINDEQFEERIAQEEQNHLVFTGALDRLMPKSGSCGENIFWYLGNKNVLFLVGYGDMYNYNQDTVPWKEYKDRINSVAVNTFITKLSEYTFAGCNIKEDIVFTGDIDCGGNAFSELKPDIKIITCQNLTLSGTHSITNNLYIKNNLKLNGNITINTEVSVGNDFDYSGNVYVYDNIYVNNTLRFTGKDVSSFYMCSGALLSADSVNFNPTPFFGSGTSYFTINSGSELVVSNDFVMKNRTLSGSNWMTHSIKTRVRGDLIINGDYMPEGGTLVQDSSNSNVTVYGNWLWYEENTYYSKAEELTSGMLKIYGDVCEPIESSGSHTLVLCGNKLQNVYRGFKVANFKNINSSSDGVSIRETSKVSGKIYCPDSKIINGKNIQLSGGIEGNIYKGDITLINPCVIDHNVTIYGNVYCFNNATGNVYINNSNIVINGDLTAEAIGFYGSGNSYLRINSQSKVNVKGDVTLKGNGFSFSNWMYHHSNCIIDGELNIDGSFYTKAYSHITLNNKQAKIATIGDFNGISNEAIDTGCVEVGGNVVYLKTSGKAKLVLNGNRNQTIDGTGFSTVIINNSQGINFSKAINVSTLFNHKGNPFTLYNNGNGSTFVDYDGDGLKDNVDPEPMVGNPCTLTFSPNNAEFGSVSQEEIKTNGGTTINVTATPEFKYRFVKWIDDNNTTVSTSSELEFVAKANKSYTAVFEKRKRNISVSCENGTINAPSSAEIESPVNVSYNPNEGYVYEDGSLKYNDTVIENKAFVMPDEDVVLSATFNRNENYFSLKDKINEAQRYNVEYYTFSSYGSLQDAINTAQSYLVNNISEEDSTAQIDLLNEAIDNLVERSVVSITPYEDFEVYWNCPDMFDYSLLKIEYDNATHEIVCVRDCSVTGFDVTTCGNQSVTVEYSDYSTEIEVHVKKRPLEYCYYAPISDQVFKNDGTLFEPEISIEFNADTLVKDKDYSIEFKKNTDIGTAEYIVTGIGNYSGEIKGSFKIYCDHNYVTSVIKEASCTETGLEEAVCSICGEHKDFNGSTTKEIPKLSHSFGSWIVDKEAIGMTGQEHRICESCGLREDREVNKLYIVVPDNWQNPCCFTWNNDTYEYPDSWPGKEMTDTGWNINGNSIYSCEFDTAKYEMVIFDSGSDDNQTADLVAQANKCYDYETNSWFNLSVNSETGKVELEEIQGFDSGYSLYGDTSDLADGVAMTTIDSQNIKATLDLDEGTYHFCIKNDVSCYGAPSVIDNKTTGMGIYLDNSHNSFTFNADGGEYVFNYNITNRRLTVTYKSDAIKALINQTFDPDESDSNVNRFGFSNDIHYKGLKLLGVQKKDDGTDSIRYVTTVSSELLLNQKIIDYGYVFTTTSKETAIAKQNASKLTVENGHVYSCKDTTNNMTEGYGNLDFGATKYKYVTAAVNNISDEKAIVARFYIRTANKTYYATYTDQNSNTFDGCVVRWNEIVSQ